jgi:sigma-B regulation protein RsbU (phosphoserine phosphatase)
MAQSRPESAASQLWNESSPLQDGGREAGTAGHPEQARILSLLYDIGKERTSILDLQALLPAIGSHVKRLVDYDLFNVMLISEDTGRLEHGFTVQFDQRIELQATLALGEGLCGTAALERKPVRVNDVTDDPRYIRCDGGIGVQSELVVPLIGKDRVLGVLDLESLRPGAFSPEHERLLATLASTVAIAVENACLYDRLRRAEQRMAEELVRAREVQQLLLPKTTPKVPGVEIGVVYRPAYELGSDFYDFLQFEDGRLAIAVGDVAGKGPRPPRCWRRLAWASSGNMWSTSLRRRPKCWPISTATCRCRATTDASSRWPTASTIRAPAA